MSFQKLKNNLKKKKGHHSVMCKAGNLSAKTFVGLYFQQRSM